MDFFKICSHIEIPDDVMAKLNTVSGAVSPEVLNSAKKGFTDPESWKQTLEECQKVLIPDEDGIKILFCQLQSLTITYSKYSELGIPEKVFIDTMKFFSRFLKEHYRVFGEYKYVWGWWAVRQLSLCEFRIGSLEYELVEENGSRWISIHIASDSDLCQTALRSSFLEARDFLARYFPLWKDLPMKCDSWMLSPSLKKILNDKSRILFFQNSFSIDKIEEDSPAFQDWIFGRRDIPVDLWPTTTSLQRGIKKHVMNGGKIEWAHGVLVEDPWIANSNQ